MGSMIDNNVLFDFSKQLYKPLEKEYLRSINRFTYGEPIASYDRKIEQIEAWARPLWLITSLIKIGEVPEPVIRKIVSGIEMGVDSSSKNYWGDFGDKDQIVVELTSVAFFLLNHPELFKGTVGTQSMVNLETYLNKVNDIELYDNNWLFFRVLINTCLRKLGLTHSAPREAEDLKAIDGMYLKDGWYSDYGRIDYYNSWAFHFYGLIYAKEIQNTDPEIYKKITDRAREFIINFEHFIDFGSGAFIPYGRSMTYRFAMSSVFSALLYSGYDAIPKEKSLAIIQKHLQFWRLKDISYPNGLLGPGFSYITHSFLESYNGFGSSYWATKAFIALPYVKNLPLYDLKDTLSFGKNIAGRLLVKRGVLYPISQDVFNNFGKEKYQKFAYSSRVAFSTDDDNHLIIKTDNHSYKSGEDKNSHLNQFFVYRKWIPAEGICARSLIIPLRHSHLRIHYIKNITGKYIEVIDYGFCHETKKSSIKNTNSLIGLKQTLITKILYDANLYFEKCFISGLSSRFMKQALIINMFSDN